MGIYDKKYLEFTDFHIHMVRLLTYIAIAIIMCSSSAAMAISFTDPFSRKANEGNEFYQQGEYEKALQAYEDAQVENPESPEIAFNLGNVFAQQGNYADAIKQFTRALEYAESDQLKARSLYNIGNCRYRQGEQALQNKNVQGAMEHLEKSVDSYKQSLQLAPDDEETKFNYELAKKKLEELRQQQQKQQQQQQQEQKKEPQDKQQQEKKKKDSGQEQKQQQKREQQKQEQEQKQEQQSERQKEQSEKKEQQQKEEEQQKKSGQQSQGQPPQQQPGKMTPQDARRLLNAIEDEEQVEQMKKLLRQRFRGTRDMEKDW